MPILLVASLSLVNISCANGHQPAPVPSSIPGNWLFTLVRHNSTEQWTFSGFLVQSGSTVTGSFLLNAGDYQGVSPATGTFDGQNLQLTVTSVQDFSLTGTMSSAGSSQASMSGQFSVPAGGPAGAWTAIQIPPLSGQFQGTLLGTSLTLQVTGTLTQGANVGASVASIAGTISQAGSASFCPYLNGATVAGFINGTTVILTFYAADGQEIGGIPAIGLVPATLSTDGTTLTGTFSLTPVASVGSTSCSPLSGQATLTFP